ncbi:MAG: PTS mannitol transporter subunit IICBA, partial [Lachnospiraceae bacterium]|nr:PTS mannitol transporter subunit IICBA [Lachnospiraceae bacterium]
MKEKVQSFGRFLSGMIMPNIGALIAWGLITSLFIEKGWLPNADLATMVGPMLNYLLPLLIAYQGGKMIGGQRGAVMGAIAVIGVIMSDPSTTMLMGAMAMGPLAGFVIKKFDEKVQGKIKPGFEMLVNNFSIGILGMLLAILGFYAMGPIMSAILAVLKGGVQILVDHGLLPLISVFVEPAKVLFLNNAINHGIFTVLGTEQVASAGKSVFYMIETNPGAGSGILLAYWFFAKDKTTRDSAPAALIVHLLGGIHEISFPYILMQPMLLLAAIGGSVAAMFYNTIFGLGLSGSPSPGSVIAYVLTAPKGETLQVLFSVVIAAVVSFLIAIPILRMGSSKTSLEEAQSQKDEMKAAAKGMQQEARAALTAGGNVDLRTLDKIIFACDAGMGSSAMGAAVLKRKLEAAGLSNIMVDHTSVSEIPAGTQYVVCHQDLVERAVKSAPQAKIVTISNFMTAPQYDQIVTELVHARENAHSTKEGREDYTGGILIKNNIRMNLPSVSKEEVIREMGRVLYECGYVTEKYTEAMLLKEDVFNTAIGNYLAIPHGIEGMTGEIKNAGLAIFTYPDGVDWGEGEIVKLVIGVASVGSEHVEVLAQIAQACETEEAVDKILEMSVDEVYEIFKV